MNSVPEDRERRIAERRERALTRLQLASSSTKVDGVYRPTSCQIEETEGFLQIGRRNEFHEIVEASSRSLHEFKEQNEAFDAPSEASGQSVVADLCHFLREAAAHLEDQSIELSASFSKLNSINNPVLIRNELQLLIQQATATEHETAAANIIHKATMRVEKECVAAAAAMAEHASTAKMALLQQLTNSHEARRAAIATEIERVELLEATLHEERVNSRQAQERVLEELRKKEHAGHDELWHQLSSQATELALELSLAKHDRLFTADKLGYNVRVLGERQKENKEVLTELQRNVHKQKALLAGLRSQYAEQKSSTSAAREKFAKDAEHAYQSLNSLKDKTLHFEIADEEELRQLVAFKEDRLSRLLEGIHDVKQEICQFCGSNSLSSFGEVKLYSPTSASTDVRINEALSDAYWRGKIQSRIPQGLQQELKSLEISIRQELQLDQK